MGRRILVCLALLASSLASLIAPSVGLAAQRGSTGLQGNTYTDPEFEFTVEWDDDTFEAEEMVGDDDAPYGVYLTGDGITASVAAGGYADVDECLDDRVQRLKDIDGVSGVRVSRRVDPLEFERDVTGAVYQYSYEDPDTGDSDTYASYFGCEPMLMDGEVQPDVVLTHDFGTSLADFEDLSAEWIPVIDGITFAEGSGSDRGDDNGNDRGSSKGKGGSADVGLSEGQYISESFGFGVTWDPDVFEAKELTNDDDIPYGVQLVSDAATDSVWAYGADSARACFNDRVDFIENVDSVSNVEEADDLELPETDPDARAALYRYDFEDPDSGDVTTFAYYFECRAMIQDGEPVDGSALTADSMLPEDEWDASLSDLEDVLASIEFDAGSSSSKGSSTDDRADKDSGADLEPGVNGNVYLDPSDGWAVTWDDSALKGENWDPGDSGDILGVQLSAESGGFMTILTGEARSLRSCVTDQVDQFDGTAFSDFEEVDDVDLPETGDDARAALYQGVFTSSQSGNTGDIYLYAECRPLVVDGEEVDGRFLIVNLISDVAPYEDELPAWSDALTSITFDAASAPADDEPEKEPTEKPKKNDKPSKKKTPTADTSQQGIDRDTYTSGLGYQISWDDSVFTADYLDPDSTGGGLTLSDQNSFLTFKAAGDPDGNSCVQAEASDVTNINGMSDLTKSSLDAPSSPRESFYALAEATLTSDNGANDVVVYIECRPMGEIQDGVTLFLVIRMISYSDGYADELPLWQDILDSVTFFQPESGQG